jgi:hypothetical protein
MRKVLAVSVLALGLAACGHGGNAAEQRQQVVLIQRGGLNGNAYSLGYQTCLATDGSRLAADLGITSTDSATLAGTLAARDFTGTARSGADRGCLDALQGRPSTPSRPGG